MSPSAQDEGSTTRLPNRSKRLSYPSSSVPTTPWHATHPASFRSRTPSPSRRYSNQSPRSVMSDSRSPLPAFSQQSKCRFMSTQTSRRRIPYTIGSDWLEDPKDTPKAALDSAKEQKLTKDMNKLYEDLIPSSNSESRRKRVVEKLKGILEETFPGKAIKVLMFGSSGNLLCTSKSDVDICITMKELESTCVLAEALSKRGMEQVTCVHAKAVPIVKIWDPELLLACDLNVNNHVAVKNTQLIKTYIELDERVRPLAMIIKHWAKQRILNEASGGALSSYTWTLLIINFLQTRTPPVLPVIGLIDSAGNQRGDFSSDLRRFRDFGKENIESLGQLFFHFFRRYGYEIDYQTAAISVRHGRVITKAEKNWQVANNNHLCVEEPFNTDRNLGNTADDTAFRGIHMEVRQAFERIASGNDVASSVCEKYEFPPEEPKPIFERPQPQSRPVIARSASQSGRGGRGRGNKHQNNYRNGHNNRRASSGAVFGPNPTGFPHNPLLPGMIPDFMPPMSQQQQSLHNHLAQLHQDLQVQEYKLKAVQMMHIQAAQAHALAHSVSRGSSNPSQTWGSGEFLSPRFGGFDSPTSAGPSHQGSYAYPYSYPSPVPMSQSSSQPGTDTNQSSPSMTPATLRRGLQRASTVNGTLGPAARSHSQPARPLAGQMNSMGYARSNNVVTSNGHMQGRYENMYPPTAYRPGYYTPTPGFYHPFAYFDPNAMTPMPREYLGYGIGESPQLHPQYVDPRFPIIPPYEDLMRSRARSASEYRHGSSMDSPFHASSHSPSPRLSTEEYVHNMSPTLMPAPMIEPTRASDHMGAAVNHTGPFVVNGSHSAPMPAQNGQAIDYNLRQIPPLNQMDYREEPDEAYTGAGANVDSARKTVDRGTQGTPDKAKRARQRTDNSTTGLGIQTVGPSPENMSVPFMGPPPPPKAKEPSTPPPSSAELPALEEKSRANRMSPDLRQRVNRRVSSAAKASMPTLDVSNKPPLLDPRGEEQPQSTPLLSPVLETRTPSPTTARKPDPKRDSYVNGTRIGDVAAPLPIPPTPLGAGEKENVNGTVRQSPLAIPHASATSQASSASGNVVNTNPWQQAGGKKGGKRNKSVNLSSTEAVDYRWKPEPLPSNEAERKGG